MTLSPQAKLEPQDHDHYGEEPRETKNNGEGPRDRDHYGQGPRDHSDVESIKSYRELDSTTEVEEHVKIGRQVMRVTKGKVAKLNGRYVRIKKQRINKNQNIIKTIESASCEDLRQRCKFAQNKHAKPGDTPSGNELQDGSHEDGNYECGDEPRDQKHDYGKEPQDGSGEEEPQDRSSDGQDSHHKNKEGDDTQDETQAEEDRKNVDHLCDLIKRQMLVQEQRWREQQK